MKENAVEILREVADVASQYTLDLIGAIVILVVGWILAGWAKRLTVRALGRMPQLDTAVKLLLARLARYLVLLFVMILVLAQFGVETTSIIAVVGSAGIGVALALQGTLSNIAAGTMLLVLRPFKVGEAIDAEGIAGTVDEIGLFMTHLRTFDGVYLTVPNGQLWNRAIKNFTRLPTRRVDLVVGVAYDDDLEKAQNLLAELMETDGRVLGEPPPQVLISELADSSVNLTLRCWVEAGDYWDVRFDLTRRAKERLDAGGISIPFPQRDVHLFDHRKGIPPADALETKGGGR
jgi:small conductance mechanosensitive channel